MENIPANKKDFAKTANEEGVRAALKGASPGLYTVPNCPDPASLKDPEMQRKFEEGPQAYITVVPNGVPTMGGKLALTFGYYVFVGLLCSYFVTRTLSVDANYLATFRVSGTVAFVAYGVAYIQESIWFGRAWGLTAKSLFDALLYGLLTGGVFGWLA